MQVDVHSLQRIQLFADWDESALRDLQREAEFRLFEAGAVLIQQGERADALYVILAGQAEVVVTAPDGQEEIIDQLGPGEPIGELGMLTGVARTATVRAVEPVLAVVLRGAAVEAAMRQAGFAHHLADTLAERLSSATRARAFIAPAERRARELDALWRAEEVLHRSLRRDDVLRGLVAIAADILHADKTSVLVWDERHQRLVAGATRGFSEQSTTVMSHGPGDGVTFLVATTGEAIAVEDAAADPRVAHRITDQENIRSLLHVPIRSGDDVLGVFGINYCEPHTFSGHEERVLNALAQRAALALENARLFESELETRERLEVALEAGRMGTWEWDASSNRVTWSTALEAIHGLAPGTFGGTFEAYMSDVHPDDRRRLEETIAASLTGADHHLEYRIIWPDGSLHWLEARGRLIRNAAQQTLGLRGVCMDVTARKLAEAERDRLLQSEKDAREKAEAAAAQAHALAAFEERQRLARELHDSVSQALYGISLGAQTAQSALDGGEVDQLAEPLQYVLELAEAGMAEMRALIFELRPESLEREGLIAALDKQAAAARARHQVRVTTKLGQEPDLPLHAKEALYRIAQEALHNVIKHAHAHAVELSLTSGQCAVTLEIVDDGRGFDPERSYPGHLGLRSMHERAEQAGATLSIASVAGRGTRVTAVFGTGPSSADR